MKEVTQILTLQFTFVLQETEDQAKFYEMNKAKVNELAVKELRDFTLADDITVLSDQSFILDKKETEDG